MKKIINIALTLSVVLLVFLLGVNSPDAGTSKGKEALCKRMCDLENSLISIEVMSDKNLD